VAGRERLSVVVITRNEEWSLGRCLASVAFADEIVVVDSESTDGTRAVAERNGARVVVEPWRGFVEQKNLALSLATCPWVLSLDADEWLSPAGAAEIRRVLDAPRADAYSVARLSSLSGGFLHRTWARDRKVRLFRRDRARFAGGSVHESIRLDPGASVARLAEPLFHESYRSIADYVERMNRYTDLAAADLAAAGARVGIVRLLLSPPLTFLKLYVLRLGFLDGVRGYVVAGGSAAYVLLKHAKVWERSRAEEREFTAAVTGEAEPVNPRTEGTGAASPERR
jgi:glycosyltransferase involved in cell wall biosynthesis